MKKLIFATVALTLLVSAAALAQDAAQPPPATASAAQAKQDPKAATSSKTVTGCLQKGDQPGEITLTASDGKIYDLRSDTVKFDEHVGHQVTATGTVTHDTKAEDKKDGQMENAAGKEAYGDLNVTDVKMVSDTCTK
jgi:opacity protein-like surface antigen